MRSLFQDLRFALRMLAKSPGFTAVMLVTLAVGIGANTAIFSLINTLMLRRLPVREPGQLVELLHRFPGEPHFNGFSWQAFQLMREHNHAISGLIAAAPQSFHVRADGVEERALDGAFVDGTYFAVLGLKPAIGRLIGPQDDHSAADRSAVAVLSWPCWKSSFHFDPSIVGKQIIVDQLPVTVVGVAPGNFTGLQLEFPQDVWLPLAAEPLINHPSNLRSPHGWGGLSLAGRLKPGVALDEARAELLVLYESTLDEQARLTNNPFLRKMKFELEPAGQGLTSPLRQMFATPLLVLMAIVSLLLLITCTNIASLLLARAAARRQEMAVRVSLGAGRFRLVRQVLTESLLLSVAGSFLSITLAQFSADALVRIMLSGRPIPGLPAQIGFHFQPDLHVLLFMGGVALLTGILFGLSPAWNAFASSPASSLLGSARTSQTPSRRLFGSALVVVQVALSIVLLSAAGLFVRHLSNLEQVDLGFHPNHVLLVRLDPEHSGLDAQQLSRAYQELLVRFEGIPGVQSATLSSTTPLSGAGASSFVKVEGFRERPEDRQYASLNWVAPKYFATLGTPLLAGRDFTLQDQQGPRVAIVNQSVARYYFGNASPIGKHFTIDRDWKGFGDNMPFEIVGVVGDANYYEIREKKIPTIYLSSFRDGNIPSTFALRTSIDPDSVAPDVRRVVHESLKTVTVGRVTTLADQVDASIVPERVVALLSGFLGALGVGLAAIGLYGLLAYRVTQRTNEIGVRMALGARPEDVLWMVLRDALVMVCLGLVIGIPLAFWSKRIAESLIADLPIQSPTPITFGVAAMVAVALLAAYLPARRAMRVDPMVALRHE